LLRSGVGIFEATRPADARAETVRQPFLACKRFSFQDDDAIQAALRPVLGAVGGCDGIRHACFLRARGIRRSTCSATRLHLPIIGIIRGSCRGRLHDSTGASVIVGMGLDIAEIDRIQAAIERHGRPFIERLFTPAEIAYCERHKNKFERFAGRFAVKEAAMKALGTGWRHGVRWRDIEITNLPGGKPTLRLSGVASEFAVKLGVKNISLSITHSGNFALAQVVFEN
jgi:holo-[acyl-carrier protein] synthase